MVSAWHISNEYQAYLVDRLDQMPFDVIGGARTTTGGLMDSCSIDWRLLPRIRMDGSC